MYYVQRMNRSAAAPMMGGMYDDLKKVFGSAVDTWTKAQQTEAYRSLLNQMIKAQSGSGINYTTLLIAGGIGLAAILLLTRN